MAKAYENGFFDDMISPYLELERDNNLRIDTNLDKLSKLKAQIKDLSQFVLQEDRE